MASVNCTVAKILILKNFLALCGDWRAGRKTVQQLSVLKLYGKFLVNYFVAVKKQLSLYLTTLKFLH